MGKLKSILIKLEDNDELELDMNGTPIIPDEVYEEAYEKECND